MLGRLARVRWELWVPLAPPTVQEEAHEAELEEEEAAVGTVVAVLGETVADLLHQERGRKRGRKGEGRGIERGREERERKRERER